MRPLVFIASGRISIFISSEKTIPACTINVRGDERVVASAESIDRRIETTETWGFDASR